MRANRAGGRTHPGVSLTDATRMATWPTPAARDVKSEECSENFREARNQEPRGKPLTWAVRETPGIAAFGCLAQTESFVVRLMILSAWLMGYQWNYLRHWPRKKDLRLSSCGAKRNVSAMSGSQAQGRTAHSLARSAIASSLKSRRKSLQP